MKIGTNRNKIITTAKTFSETDWTIRDMLEEYQEHKELKHNVTTLVWQIRDRVDYLMNKEEVDYRSLFNK